MIAARRHLPGAFAAAFAAAALGPGPAAGQSAQVTYSSELPSNPTGLDVRIYYDSRDANGRSRPLRRHVFTFPPGTVVDPGGAAVCTASAQELTSGGLSACPPGSRVGGGTLTAVVTDPPGSLAGPLHTNLTIFNASRPKDAPSVEKAFIVAVSVGGQVRTAFVAPVNGNVLTEEPPPVCARPGEQPPCPSGEITVQSVQYSIENRSSSESGTRRHLMTTPPSCPPSGSWTFGHVMDYRDGFSATTSEASACDPSAAERIQLRMTPRSVRRCRATRFVFTAVTSGQPVAGATVRFANRRAQTDGQGRAAIPARICAPGRRRATVKAEGLRKGVASVAVVR